MKPSPSIGVKDTLNRTFKSRLHHQDVVLKTLAGLFNTVDKHQVNMFALCELAEKMKVNTPNIIVKFRTQRCIQMILDRQSKVAKKLGIDHNSLANNRTCRLT